MIEAFLKVIEIDFDFPINLGNNSEISLNQLANLIISNYGDNGIQILEPTQDDPRTRKPDITKAEKILGWTPSISIEIGIHNTYDYFKKHIDEH